jgi:hypothetical protein
MISDYKTSGMIWRLFERRKMAGWMVGDYLALQVVFVLPDEQKRKISLGGKSLKK